MASAFRWQVLRPTQTYIRRACVSPVPGDALARRAGAVLGRGRGGGRDGWTGFFSPGPLGFPQEPGRPLRTGVHKCPCSAFIREEGDFREPQTCLPPRPPISRSRRKRKRRPESFSFSTLQPWPGHQALQIELLGLSCLLPVAILSPPSCLDDSFRP